MFDLQKYLEPRLRRINAELARRLPPATMRPAVLHKAMRYSVLAGGKRLRPILCLAAADIVRRHNAATITAGLAIEILHTYTLIHDDLPGMDNDSLRRGKPTAHVVFGEANAILAGDALLTMAFEWLSKIRPNSVYAPERLIGELAQAAGNAGVIAGQVEDLAAEGHKPNPQTVLFIHRHKTAALLKAALRMGAITAGASAPMLQALTRYGEAIGLAFQIADDILNETADAATLGKAVGSDRQRAKMTFVAARGLEAARAETRRLTGQAIAELSKLPGNTEPLAALARMIAERKN